MTDSNPNIILVMDRIFLLHCTVAASVRQTTKIEFNDLGLPEQVIEALANQQSIPVRSNLSGKLKEHLSRIRTEQRKLYDECTISNGDIHFLHESCFDRANDQIMKIRVMAEQSNAELADLWFEEYQSWMTMVRSFVEPIFVNDPEGKQIATDAYLSMFPTKDEFSNPIEVFVVGPNPIRMEVSSSKEEHGFLEIDHVGIANTSEVLEAAQHSAADRALEKAAELLDDLDTRASNRVKERQTGTSKRRGSWELIAEKLELITKHCPGFDELSLLCRKLIEQGVELQITQGLAQVEAMKCFSTTKVEIREELKQIISRRDSTDGLEAVKKSLSLSGTYRDLVSRISVAESEEELFSIEEELRIETSVYHQRAKHLQKLFDQRTELISIQSGSIAKALDEIKNIDNPDF